MENGSRIVTGVLRRMTPIVYTDGTIKYCLIVQDFESSTVELSLKGFEVLEEEPSETQLKDAFRKYLTDNGMFFERPKQTRPHSRMWKYGYDILPEEKALTNKS